MKIENRWLHYKNYNCKAQVKLHNSLKKYGSENHMYEVIWEGFIGDMLKMERMFGDRYNVLDFKLGLNLVLPGYDDIPRVVSKETKIRQSESSGKSVVMYGENGVRLMEFPSTKVAASYLNRHPSSVSGACRTKTHKVSGYYFRYKCEFDEPLLDDIKKTINTTGLKINQICLKTLKVIKTWSSITEACKSLRLDKNKISAVCKGRILKYKGFKWEYEISDCKDKICQIDIRTNTLVHIWENAKLAGRSLNISDSNIYAAIKGIRRKTCGGFIWKYYSDYLSSQSS
jgi:hypothetical protein